MRKHILFIISFLISTYTFGTHNRAGEITYTQISSFTYEFTVTTYTNTKPTSDGIPPADRPSLIINWGDGTSSEIYRSYIIELPDYIRKNIYIAQHTFSGAGTFELMVEDPNRNEGVSNIPNSVQTVFSIKTILQINPTLGFNNAPILLNPPVDKAAVGKKFIHNPAAFDKDGDSLSYEMTVCTGENGEPIPNYQFPASSHEPIYIDSIEGNLIWNAPVNKGTFNVAFHIFEWRNGIKIGRITRDMQIEVYETDNTPPKFNTLNPICVEAGDTVSFEVSATDPEGEKVTITASGGIFNIDSNAEFNSTPKNGTSTGSFFWVPQCEHVRQQPYNIIFKATDNNSEVNLVDQISTDITVIAPAPKNLTTSATSNAVELNWDSYFCTNQIGFNIYRKINPYGFLPAACETGVPPYTDFKLIATINESNSTNFIDNNNQIGLNQGYEYCYLITALFDNKIESKASDEVCTELVRGIPIITNVSVEKHDDTNGEIYLAWSKPIEFDHDTYPGPLMYIIKRAEGVWGTNYVNIDTLFNFNTDTTYFDTYLNTKNGGYSYQIAIYDSNGKTEPPMTASSMFPVLKGTDKSIEIHIQKNTPWTNTEYRISRKDQNTETFNFIGTTETTTYTDTYNLQNKEEYCYRISSTGSYDLEGIIKPIVNHSHENCGIPIDTIPPKSPTLNLDSDCETFINHLNWTLNSPVDDIMQYYIYFTPSFDGQFQRLDSIKSNDSLSYAHSAYDSPSGCYTVTAVDSSFNESTKSDPTCVDICSYYELPNVFTPNNDNRNDLFVPLTPPEAIDNLIEKIDLKLYSRWGNLIYETTNPKINWDGKSKQSNKFVSDGVYYYVCEVYEKRISGIEHRTLVGFVHIFNGTTKNKTE